MARSLYPELLGPSLPAMGEGSRWLVTGAAGFIGSHLVEALLSLGQRVTALDDLSTGHRENVERAVDLAGPGASGRLSFVEGSIEDPDVCARAVDGAQIVLHHAALASVPASVEAPARCARVNVQGFVHVLEAARAAGTRRVVYASSSAVYGDGPRQPKIEEDVGACLSPYALSKLEDELCAELWTHLYGLECVGLRYFNVFGPRQDPAGAYAAVIPRWIAAVRSGEPPVLYGDGSATRDFCSVRNVVLACILAATREAPGIAGGVFNIACGERTSLRELLRLIAETFAPGMDVRPIEEPARAGDILHSSASIDRAREALGYRPLVSLEEGLREMAEQG